MARLDTLVCHVGSGRFVPPGNETNGERPRVARMLEANISLARLGTPAEFADVVRFLCSDEVRFFTGAIWTVDGGQVRA